HVGRAAAVARDALVRLARSLTRGCPGGLDGPAAVAPPGAARAREWARPLGVGPGARARGEELGRGAGVRELAPPGPRRAPHAVALVTLGANRLAAPLSTLACDQPGGPARVDRPAAARWTLAPLECALDGLHTPSAARDRARGWRPAARVRA